MKLFIRELIIWPEDPNFDPQVIAFDPEKIMVVTGWSGTGKTSIVAIINYVLGAGTSAIPLGVIRDTASWYGLLIETDLGMMRLARKKQTSRAASDEYWWQQGPEVEEALPRRPKANAKTDRIKLLFDDLSKLSNLDTDPDGGAFTARASFRDMAAFNFLPQHIVANPYTMFFKADTTKHREKLRNVMPLALGIITNDDLVRMHTRKLLRDRLRELQAALRVRSEAIERWRANLTGAFFQAQELGLLPAGDMPEKLEAVVELLRSVVESGGRTAATAGRITAAVVRLEGLRVQERDLDRKISDGRRRLRRLRSLRGSVSDYGDVLADQRQRVKGAGWFREAIVADECVLCGSDSGAAKRALEELEAPIAELEDLSEGASSTPPIVDREILEIERELLVNEESLLLRRQTRITAEAEVDRERGQEQTLEKVYRFIGSTEQALRMLGEVEGEGGLADQIKDLIARIAQIDGLLDEVKKLDRVQQINRKITASIKRVIELLEIEGADGIPMLDQRELNVKFQRDGADNADFLWEIGSGENWMAYHLAMILALHTVFLSRRENNPVPTFLVIDQPSQVYFPSDTYKEFVENAENARSGVTKSEDMKRTRKIFEMLSKVRDGLKGLQIIVLEHADENTWGEVASVAEAANWRGGKGLIPSSWRA